MMLFQVKHSTSSVSGRFDMAHDVRLLDPNVRATSKHTLFLNFVYRAMKHEVSPPRVSAFIKRLLQVVSVMYSVFIFAVIFLLSELGKVRPQLRPLIDEAETAGDDEGGDASEEVEEEEEEEIARVEEEERTTKVLAQLFGEKVASD
ncbi:hypothetical protein PsorP6_010154 [Peronosclerospora sorghi]|uniref:Uncharacterized protein n=1 Tax=Peronosclerospora sorghi TaxID=230839 RepID=A0ACC0VVT6_9STRA|nr:hypothetical protein PsorP6_010154 [Peronosclerospora sorghi]